MHDTISIPRHSVRKRGDCHHNLILMHVWELEQCSLMQVSCDDGYTRTSTLAIHKETETQHIMSRYSAILMQYFSKM